MGASSVCSNEAYLSSLGVPPLAFQDMIKANIDKPVRVGLVRCERSVPPAAQAKYNYMHQARQDYQLDPHEFNWAIMDLDDDPRRPLYNKPKDCHFATANQTLAISKLVGKALAELAVDHASTSTAEAANNGTASSSQPRSAEPHYREGLTVIVCGSWNTFHNKINAEILATRDLADATTLRATLLAAYNHTVGSAHTAHLIGGPQLIHSFLMRLNQTYIHDNMPGPGQRHQACLSSFRRVFVDDAGQLETVKSLIGSVGHRLYTAFKANAHRADIFRYMDHYLRGGLYLDIKTALLEPLERIQERVVVEFKADESLIAHAANFYGWDPIALAASGPPDYFMTAIGKRKDHIFQGILLGRPGYPLMLAALLHCFGPTLVDQQDLSGFRYMAFCEELFRVINADRYQGAGSPLKAGRVLGFGLGPIYLL
eukprot:s5830_g4.t1